MVTSFLDKYIRYTILFVILVEIFSFCANLYPLFNSICFGVILFVVLFLTLEKLEYGVYIMLAELMIGSQGYLFSLDLNGLNLSIRIGIFLIVMTVWLVKAVSEKRFPLYKHKLFWPYIALGVFILMGIVLGKYYGNSASNLFFDVNGFLYFAFLLPLAHVLRTWDDIFKVFKIMGAALFVSALKVLFLIFVFSHNITYVNSALYTWVRDTRVGEITRIQDYFYRIFFQSQIYSLIGIFVLSTYIFGTNLLSKVAIKKKINWSQISLLILTVLMMLSLLVSLSRSFWVGFIGAIVLFLFVFLFVYKKHWLGFKTVFYFLYAVSITAMLLITVTVKFPWPSADQTAGSSFDIISQRASAGNNEAALSSRWSLLPPLWQEIKKKPIFGHGFGKTVTYISSDPRVRAATAGQSGEYTTFAFEWGYLDMWLKFGIVGVIAYLVILVLLFIKGWKVMWLSIKELSTQGETSSQNLLITGLWFGFIALCLVNGFTPYLNHPLGISYLGLCSVVFYMDKAR